MPTSLLPIAQGAATSAEFTIGAGVTDRIFLVDADGGGVPFRGEARVQRKGSNGQFFNIAWLTFWEPSAQLEGPGTFRVQRDDGDAAVGVDRDTGADALAAISEAVPRLALSTQAEFERLLEIGGAVFNGTSDDGPAIQYAIDNISADGKFKEVSLPSGGVTALISSANGAMNASGIYGGIVVPSTLSFDFKRAVIKSNGINASTFLVGVKGKAGSIDPPRGNLKTVIKNADLIAENVTIGGVLYMDGAADVSAAALLTFKNLNMRGSSSQGGLVGYGGNGYLNRFYDCGFSTTSPGAAAFQGPMFGSNAGECFNFTSCVFYNCVAGSAPVVYLNTSASGIDYNFFGCSFDYNNLRPLFGFASQATTMRVSLYGCHIEDYKNSSSPNPMVTIPAGSANTSFNMFGGEIDLFSAGAGSAPAYLFNAGTSGASAPNGISLDRVAKRIGAQVLANAAATARFVDNQ